MNKQMKYVGVAVLYSLVHIVICNGVDAQPKTKVVEPWDFHELSSLIWNTVKPDSGLGSSTLGVYAVPKGAQILQDMYKTSKKELKNSQPVELGLPWTADQIASGVSDLFAQKWVPDADKAKTQDLMKTLMLNQINENAAMWKDRLSKENFEKFQQEAYNNPLLLGLGLAYRKHEREQEEKKEYATGNVVTNAWRWTKNTAMSVAEEIFRRLPSKQQLMFYSPSIAQIQKWGTVLGITLTAAVAYFVYNKYQGNQNNMIFRKVFYTLYPTADVDLAFYMWPELYNFSEQNCVMLLKPLIRLDTQLQGLMGDRKSTTMVQFVVKTVHQQLENKTTNVHAMVHGLGLIETSFTSLIHAEQLIGVDVPTPSGRGGVPKPTNTTPVSKKRVA